MFAEDSFDSYPLLPLPNLLGRLEALRAERGYEAVQNSKPLVTAASTDQILLRATRGTVQ